MELFLYRVLENDDNGDPLDFGPVRAENAEQAVELIKQHLQEIGLVGLLPVRIYRLTDTGLAGVLDSPSKSNHLVHLV